MAVPVYSDSKQALQLILNSLSNNADYFGVLQLPKDAPANDVRDAYFKLAKVVHPDLPIFINDPKLRLEATRAFQAITLAHATLSDPQKRLMYTSGIEVQRQQKMVEAMTSAVPSSSSKSGQHEAQVTPETAKIYFARGKISAGRKDWQVAQDALQLALPYLAGDELAEAQLNLAWSLMNNPKAAEIDRVTKAKELLFAVLASHPKHAMGAQAHYYLGVWNKFNGDMREAAKHFDGCLTVDPRHIEAKREKMILERRRGPDPAKPLTGRPASASSTKIPASSPSGMHQKIALEKKPTFLERLFGKKS